MRIKYFSKMADSYYVHTFRFIALHLSAFLLQFSLVEKSKCIKINSKPNKMIRLDCNTAHNFAMVLQTYRRDIQSKSLVREFTVFLGKTKGIRHPGGIVVSHKSHSQLAPKSTQNSLNIILT